MTPTDRKVAGRRAFVLFLTMVLLAPAAILAQDAATATLAPPACIPVTSNSVVNVTLAPPTGWISVRVYFRAAGSQDFYYMEMQAVGDGTYMAVLPKPQREVTQVQIMVAGLNESSEQVRTETVDVDVTSDCPVTLTSEEQRMASSLVIGNTIAAQFGHTVIGFLCDGIVSRVDINCNIYPDDACRCAALLAAAGEGEGKKWLVPLILGSAVVGAGAVIFREEKKPASPSKP
jgi:hypothetical protein